jgi:hypothetical protein
MRFDEDIELKILDDEICLDVGEGGHGMIGLTREKAALMAKVFQHFAEHGVLPNCLFEE